LSPPAHGRGPEHRHAHARCSRGTGPVSAAGHFGAGVRGGEVRGAAYLIYLGIQALRTRAGHGSAATFSSPRATKAPLTQAILAGTLNPKVALFFLAFLPQFVDPARGSVVLQMLILGATMAVMDTLYELALVSVLYRMRERLARNQRFMAWQSRISGVILIALGLRLAAQQR
jgi:threonine/homoserine/homoserine lactone efflux protein